MKYSGSAIVPWLTGLSARLLVLTIAFVMLSEVLIYAPSIGRYRLLYMEERIAAAHLASLALAGPSADAVDGPLLRELLDHARSRGIVLRRPDSKALLLSGDMPTSVAATYDLRDREFFMLIWDALRVLSRDGSRFIRVIGVSPKGPDIIVETIIDEAPLRAEMLDYSGRIVALSLFISLMTACLVYLSLHLLFVRPMLGITQSMVDFQGDPENASHMMVPGRRRDEIGRAQRELAEMQSRLRTALQQRSRLAALGTAVAKINHDLRNILATARLVSDHVESSEDPNVRRIAPTLLGAIDRAIKLCSETLEFAHDVTPAPRPTHFDLAGLVDEVGGEIVDAQDRRGTLDNGLSRPFEVFADRDQLFRVLFNLVLNAFEARADRVTISAQSASDGIHIEVADNGAGLPKKVREKLFQPFSGSGRSGGTGLGLSIARDLMRGHGGDIELAETEGSGTVFRLRLPSETGQRTAQ